MDAAERNKLAMYLADKLEVASAEVIRGHIKDYHDDKAAKIRRFKDALVSKIVEIQKELNGPETYSAAVELSEKGESYVDQFFTASSLEGVLKAVQATDGEPAMTSSQWKLLYSALAREALFKEGILDPYHVEEVSI